MVEVKYSEQKDADLKNISDSLKIKTANPEFPGNQKYPKKIQGILMRWEKILDLQHKNWGDDEVKALYCFVFI